MKLRIENKISLVFVLLIGIILGIMVGVFLVNQQKAIADKNYIDSQKQKLDVENKVNAEETKEKLEQNEKERENPAPTESDEITIVPTMYDAIEGNTAYCPTFQIVWNELADYYVSGNSIEFLNGQLTIADNLNKRGFTKNDISDEYYYVKVGKQLVSVKKEIEDGISEKFNETSDILDLVDWTEDSSVNVDEFNMLVFYSMLKREFEFENPFDILTEDGVFNKYMYVTYFGINENSDSELNDQVDVLFYNNENDFAAKLITKSGDEVIVSRIENDYFDNFDSVYKYIEDETNNYSGKKYFTSNDYIKVPNIEFNVLKKYEELIGKKFLSDENILVEITAALQTIKFKLDNEGGEIKSEALIGVVETAAIDIDEPVKVEHRYFYCTDDFYMFLKEDDKTKPYFALKVTDIDYFQENAKEMRYYYTEEVEEVEEIEEVEISDIGE